MLNKEKFNILKNTLRPYRRLIIPLLPIYADFQLLLLRCKRKLTFCFNKKYDNQSTYSLIVACYNVSAYIDNFVDSVICQSVGFKKCVQLILVDDGSTDDTYTKLNEWQQRYPENIVLLRQKNSGQAAARNLGLSYAVNEWVSFPDADDFLDVNYLKKVDEHLVHYRGKGISMVCTHCVNYYEKKQGIVDDHPLSFHFKESVVIEDLKSQRDFFQLFSNSCFFKLQILKENHLSFSLKCRPNFEDALLVNTYLIYSTSTVSFITDAIYFYRKRVTHDSTLDRSWVQEEKYFDVLKYGYLELLNLWYQRKGEIPQFIQHLVLYDLSWYFLKFINNEEELSFLSPIKKSRFLILLNEIFSKISVEVITASSLITPYLKAGILSCMKHVAVIPQTVSVEKVDYNHKQLLLCYFTNSHLPVQIISEHKTVKPDYEKSIRDLFLGEQFITKKYFWITLSNTNEALKAYLNKSRITFLHHNMEYLDFYIETKKYPKKGCSLNPFNNCWLISDRDIQADDNGEFFYRYLRQQHPEINIFFLLNRDSSDWARLKKDNFKLISFGSIKHRIAMRYCQKNISSHADTYNYNYFNDKTIPEFIFLQHGVIQNDLSAWLNNVMADVFITSSNAEYRSIVDKSSNYVYFEREVKLTGLPRHDYLLQNNRPQKLILIMPTWRKSIVGSPILGNVREINPEFGNSKYATCWQNFLLDENFHKLVKNNGYEVIFSPHINIQPYISFFQIPNYIKVVTQKDISLQKLFASASFMITDYSSVAFDMAYLRKKVLYYQFDYDEVNREYQHIFKKGYFSYEKLGFGDVCKTKTELINAIKRTMENNSVPEGIYLQRMKEFYKYHDRHNCDRCFAAITSEQK